MVTGRSPKKLRLLVTLGVGAMVVFLSTWIRYQWPDQQLLSTVLLLVAIVGTGLTVWKITHSQ